jgi:glycosyltransferase involved in cell wall biosynthesis
MKSFEIDDIFSTHHNLVAYPAAEPVSPPVEREWGGIRKMGYGKKDRHEFPLISVITVVKNSAGSIRETIESVIHQTYPNIEFLVIDGGSDDGTLEIIRQYNDKIDLWISGSDNGIYDAMNKALDLAQGRHVHFLNADDHYLHSRAIEIVMGTFINGSPRWVHANILMLDKRKGRGWIRYSNVSKYYYLFKGMPQQAFFFEKKLYDDYGYFDPGLRVVGDLDFLLRIMLKHHIPGRYLNMPAVVFDKGGISGNMEGKKAEREEVLRKYFPRWTFWLIKNRLFAWLLTNNETHSRKKSFFEKCLSSIE